MTEEPDRVNETEGMRVDSTILKLAEQRAAIDARRKELNEDAREINANVDKLGITPAAFMLGVRIVKGMSKGERADYLSSVRRVTKVIGERQMELYPEETKQQEEREAKAKEKAAEAKTKAGRDPDHPRSNPKSGGAAKGKRPTQDELTEAAAEARDTAEIAEGEKVLEAMH